MPAARARRLCPQAVFLAPDFPTYRDVSARMMAIVRRQVEHVEVVGLDEAYLDLAGLFSPRAAMRRLVAEIASEVGLTCSVGIGENKLIAKVASDAEKPAGFVVLTREQACERFASARPGLVPGIGPKTAAKLEAMGLTTLGALAAARRARARRALRAQPRARAPAACALRARGPGLERAQGRLGVARADVRHRPHRSRRDARRDARDGALAVREPRAPRAQRPHDRHQGAARRLDDRDARAHAGGRRPAIPRPSRREALRLLAAYAPPRPVRLLGVRVAGLHADGAEARGRRGRARPAARAARVSGAAGG